jgi:hypothetical protein
MMSEATPAGQRNRWERSTNADRRGGRPWCRTTRRNIIELGGLAMHRGPQVTLCRYIVAVAVIGYFCAFRELAVLLGIFLAALLFVAPMAAVSYFACRFLLGAHRRPSAPVPPPPPMPSSS